MLQGEGAEETRIHTIEPGPAFTIQSPNPLSFTLQQISLQTRTLERETDHFNAGVFWRQDRNTSAQQTILIEEVKIEGYIGVEVVAWKGQLHFSQSRIYGVGGGLGVMGGGDLEAEVEKNIFIGPSWSSPTFPFSTRAITIQGEVGGGRVQAVLKDNEIRGWDLGGLAVVSASHLGGAGVDVLVEGNKITSNWGQGVYLAGDVAAGFIRNKILKNDYGVVLSLPPCLTSQPLIPFQGTIRGADNDIQGNNKGDLCPLTTPGLLDL